MQESLLRHLAERMSQINQIVEPTEMVLKRLNQWKQ
jgi:hypothetical protein